MQLRPHDWVLAVLVVATLAIALSLRPDHRRPNYEFLPDMAHSPHFGAFEPNPNFPDGKTWQVAPAGTIARGELPLRYAATPEDALRAGRELRNPYGDDPAVLERGARQYAIYCTPCHGGGGLADGPVVQRGYPPPPSLLLPNAKQMADGQLFHVITWGQGNMPSHAAQIEREDRWKIVRYVRSLQDETP